MKSPLITMSAITGKPTRQEVFDYMKGLKDNGIDQAMVYPRSGCGLDYLEDEWFETVSLPEGITKITNATFYSCPALREIEFRGVADTVEIAQCGIGYCHNLVSIKSKRRVSL